MIDDRQLGRALQSWLDEEPAILPVHVFDGILAEVPGVHQRRAWPWDRLRMQRTTRLLVVAALLALAIGSLALIGAGLLRQPPRPFPFGEIPLLPGRYVVDGAFPVRFSIDIPDGWAAIEREESWIQLGRDIADGSIVTITTVDATTSDPCRPDLGVDEALGPTDEDLAMALFALPRVDGPIPTQVPIGGRPGWLVRLIPPSRTPTCPENPERDSLALWALPHNFSLSSDGAIDVRVVTVHDARIVIASEHNARTTIGERAAVDAVVNTIRFAEDSSVVPDASPVVIPIPEGVNPSDAPVIPIIPTIPDSGPVDPVPSFQRVAVYGTGPDGRSVRLESVGNFVTQPPRDWFGTIAGIVSSEDLEGAAAIEVWSIESIYTDPCHWRTSNARVSNVDLDRLAESLRSDWAPVDLNARPRAGPVHDPAWMGQRIRTITLAMDPDLEVSGCDGGEVRLWVDPEARSRPVWPGMTLELYLLDAGGGNLALAKVAPRAMTESVRLALDDAWSSTSIIVWDPNAP